MHIRVFDNAADASRAVADRLARALALRPATVLGLAAGQTPVRTYALLGEWCAAGRLDFSAAVTFNLDEFVGVGPDHPGSFRRFMTDHLFARVNLHADRIQFLDGMAADIAAECARYERALDAAGGIDLQLLGIGRNGHIGFNEPADALTAATHRVTLLEPTRQANASLFGGEAAAVPAEALTMGLGAIMRAREIALLAFGAPKAAAVARAVEGGVTPQVPASFLQLHRETTLYLDRDAAQRLG